MKLSRAIDSTRPIVIMRAALISYGFLNAVLYASLLPLWEGFDEPFHYGYVQELSSGRGIPVLGKTPMSSEVWMSLKLAPASDAVKHNLHQVTTFGEYFRLSEAERSGLRAQLDHVPRGGEPSGLNYEAHQAPLAYALLAVTDRAWANASLSTRVWRLRLICGIFASLTTTILLFLLSNRLGLAHDFQFPMVFAVLSSQMFYATTAHVANDWLAVPLMVLLFERLIAVEKTPGLRNVLLLSAAFVAGLLTKSYFLALTPVLFGVVLWVAFKGRLAPRNLLVFVLLVIIAGGPWYIRNALLYQNLSGMQGTRGGTDWLAVLKASVHVPWLRSLRDLVYASLWTGNNTFRTFSSRTLTLLLAGLVAAGALYAKGLIRHRPSAGERLLLVGFAAWTAALAYVTTVSFWSSHGEAITASPWYTQPFAPIVLCLLFCGLSRCSYAGRAVTVWLVCLSAYVITASYWAKLIPLYAGYEGRSVLLKLVAWYRGNFASVSRTLATTAMRGPTFIFTLAAIMALATFAFAVALSMRVYWAGPEPSPSRDQSR